MRSTRTSVPTLMPITATATLSPATPPGRSYLEGHLSRFRAVMSRVARQAAQEDRAELLETSGILLSTLRSQEETRQSLVRRVSGLEAERDAALARVLEMMDLLASASPEEAARVK
jgi:hypothetical protein